MLIRHSTLLLGAAVCALISTASAQVTPTTPPAKPETGAIARLPTVQPRGIAQASSLVGKQVVDNANKSVGEIKDLVTCGAGELIALVERESDDKLVGVPMSVLTARMDSKSGATLTETAKVNDFLIGSEAKLGTAPIVVDKQHFDAAW